MITVGMIQELNCRRVENVPNAEIIIFRPNSEGDHHLQRIKDIMVYFNVVIVIKLGQVVQVG